MYKTLTCFDLLFAVRMKHRQMSVSLLQHMQPKLCHCVMRYGVTNHVQVS